MVVAELCRRAGWELKHDVLVPDQKVEVTPDKDWEAEFSVTIRSWWFRSGLHEWTVFRKGFSGGSSESMTRTGPHCNQYAATEGERAQQKNSLAKPRIGYANCMGNRT